MEQRANHQTSLDQADGSEESENTPHHKDLKDSPEQEEDEDGDKTGGLDDVRRDEISDSESLVPQEDGEKKLSVDEDGEDEEVKTSQSSVPIDRGWAWIVAFSCFVIAVVFSSINQVVATLLTDILETFDVSVSVISTTFSVASLGRCVTTMLAANVLLPRMSIRVMVTTAAVVNVLCTFAIVAFPSIIVFCGALFIKELSKGFTIISSLTLVGHYFQRHRGIATALALMGFSFCGAAIPPIIRYLKDEFGFRSSFLLYAGLEMQAVVVGLLLRPIRSYKRKQLHSTAGEVIEVKTIQNKLERSSDNASNGDGSKLHHRVLSSKSKEAGDVEIEVNEEKETLLQSYDNKPSTQTMEAKEGSDTDQLYQVVSNDSKDSSSQTKSVPSAVPKDTSKSLFYSNGAHNQDGSRAFLSVPEDTATGDDNSCCTLPKYCLCLKDLLQIFKPALFRHYVCLVLCMAYSVNICAIFVLMYLPTHAQSVGVSRRDSASLLTIAGIAEFTGRLISGLLGDRKWLRPGTIISISCLLMFVTCQLAGILKTFWSLAGFSLVIGFLGCFGQNLMSLLIVDTLGLDSLASVFAMGSLFGAVSFAAAHAIHGILIEVTGGFLVTFSLTGCGFLVGAILLLSLPLVRKLQSRKEQREAEQNTGTAEALEAESSV